jgi:AraC-like DNA-binding protein
MSYEHSNVYHRIPTVENYGDIHLEAMRFIEANYGNSSLAITDFVKAKGISQRQVQRALSFYDTTFVRMLLSIRMDRAKELLAHSGEPVEAIANNIGYDVQQFNRTFRAEEGMGPEEYQKWQQTQQS